MVLNIIFGIPQCVSVKYNIYYNNHLYFQGLCRSICNSCNATEKNYFHLDKLKKDFTDTLDYWCIKVIVLQSLMIILRYIRSITIVGCQVHILCQLNIYVLLLGWIFWQNTCCLCAAWQLLNLLISERLNSTWKHHQVSDICCKGVYT